MKSKNEVGLVVRDNIAMLERQLKVKIQQFGSNNGSEFVNLIMDLFCRWNGIFYKTTNPYLLEQNGIIKHVIVVFF